jgi:hypothetical protein
VLPQRRGADEAGWARQEWQGPEFARRR